MRRLIPVILLPVVLLGAAAPALGAVAKAQRGERLPDQVVLSGDVHVPKGVSSGDVVILHGKAVIDGAVQGSVVVFKGPIVISGLVHGDVAALDGPIVLRRGAHVTGDVWHVHGPVLVEVGARIDGRVRRGGLLRLVAPSAVVARFAVWLAITVSTLLLGLVLLLLAPRAADAVFEAARTAAAKSVGWGFAIFFGLPVAAVILVFTLVGIPFGVGLLLALALLYSVGYVWTAWILGRVMVRPSRHGRRPRRYPAFLAGWAILRGIGFVPVLGLLTWFAAALFGLGVMTVAVWRAGRGAGLPRAVPVAAGAAPPGDPEGPPAAGPT